MSVIIPAYNEQKSIGRVIEQTEHVMKSMRVPYEIIVVDDGSTDNTTREASAHRVTVVTYPKNRGKGHALRKGFQQAKGEIIVTIDSDGSHRPKEIPGLLTPIFRGADIVAGSRFMVKANGFTTGINRVGNFLFNMAIAALTGRLVTDSQTGFRALRKEVIDKMNLDSTGFEIESEITVKGLKNGFKFEEKPITCKRRRYDISRLKILRDGQRILKTIIKANFAKIQH